MKIRCETKSGGAVEFNKRHGVWASYAVAAVDDKPAPEIMYAGAKLGDGRAVQFFLNRHTGLIVVDVIDRNNKGGTEILRRNI